MIFQNLNAVNPSLFASRAETLGLAAKSLHDMRQMVLAETTALSPLNSLQGDGPLRGCSVILGIPDDRGVQNNRGNIGAKDGPEAFRRAFYRLYDTLFVNFLNQSSVKKSLGELFVDAGNLVLADSIPETHERLAECVKFLLLAGAQRIFVIGGGHDFAYGTYRGHVSAVGGIVPIVNLDAHLDLRPMENGVVNSGTPFFRAITELPEHLAGGRALLEMGIQRERNPMSLFSYAREKGVSVVEFCSFSGSWRNLGSAKETNPLNHVLDHLDHCRALGWSRDSGRLHFSVDLDVFHSGLAPGTSASTAVGCSLAELRGLFSLLGKMVGCAVVDIAELCPARDMGDRTAQLAASLVYQLTVLQASKTC